MTWRLVDQPCRRCRQQVGERAPSRAVRILDRLFLQQQPEVELQRPLTASLTESAIGVALTVPSVRFP